MDLEKFLGPDVMSLVVSNANNENEVIHFSLVTDSGFEAYNKQRNEVDYWLGKLPKKLQNSIPKKYLNAITLERFYNILKEPEDIFDLGYSRGGDVNILPELLALIKIVSKERDDVLFCRLCNQYFVTCLHSSVEHLLILLEFVKEYEKEIQRPGLFGVLSSYFFLEINSNLGLRVFDEKDIDEALLRAVEAIKILESNTDKTFKGICLRIPFSIRFTDNEVTSKIVNFYRKQGIENVKVEIKQPKRLDTPPIFFDLLSNPGKYFCKEVAIAIWNLEDFSTLPSAPHLENHDAKSIYFVSLVLATYHYYRYCRNGSANDLLVILRENGVLWAIDDFQDFYSSVDKELQERISETVKFVAKDFHLSDLLHLIPE